jgi:hypothetical protein
MLNVTHLFVQEATVEQGRDNVQPSYRKPSCSFMRASSATSSRSNLQSFLSNLGIGSQQEIDCTPQQREGRVSMAGWRTNSARNWVLICLDINGAATAAGE